MAASYFFESNTYPKSKEGNVIKCKKIDNIYIATNKIWIKAMRKLENSVILCSAEIDLTGIPTNRILTEIN